ncbi:twin-arginine translocation signal domain-containing protein [Kribbella sp.]|uniref:twin-arginine translocation signal domain-containing protein n=1 Tax=Kribbella sp. TaxID=1871183 RepID=UPI002D4369AB|nr:twin-arginine translocation signal domain-containing protein [Kribbella sp.]HZX07104.1 twin-arginine translocation signal domain-containing protein [Kribbella sp.]
MIHRRTFLKLSAAAAAAVPFAALTPQTASAATTLTAWGVCGHPPSIDDTSYPASGVQDQLALAASLGVGYYRVDFLLPTLDAASTDWSWYDAVVSAARAHGVQLMAILTVPDAIHDRDNAFIQSQVSMLVSRYAGQIPLYQIQNEMDGACINGPGVDGSSINDYNPDVYGPVRDRMWAICDGVRASDSQAGRVVNMTWKHTGFLQLLNNDGLPYEVNGLDWYWGMDDMLAVLEVINRFRQSEILLTELNITGGTQSSSEADQANYLATAVQTLRASAPDKVHGVYVYELLDQPAWDDSQAHYGLVNVNPDGSWGAHKQAFGTFHQIITG